MRSKRLLALLVCVMMFAAIFTGCSSSKKTSTEDASNKEVVVTLGCWASSPAETQLLDNQIQAFQNKYPNITIKTVVITGDYNQAMQTKIASKTAPDVYYLDVSLATQYMSKGVLAPLDEYLDKNDVTDFESNLLKGYQLNGKTYGLPKDYNTLGLFYNKDMLAQANVQVPTTWDELTTAAQKLTTGKVKGLALSDDNARFIPFFFQAGGKVIDDSGKPVLTSAEDAKGLDYYYSFFKKGYAATPKDLGDGWNGDSFAKKKVAMVIEGGWLVASMAQAAPDVKYGIAKLPKGDNDGDLAFTVAYVMNKDSKHKTEAAEVLKFLTGKDAQELTAESGLAIPTRKSMNTVYAQKHPDAKALVDMTDSSQVYDFGINGSKILDALNKAGEKLRLGQAPDAATALKQAQDSLQ